MTTIQASTKEYLILGESATQRFTDQLTLTIKGGIALPDPSKTDNVRVSGADIGHPDVVVDTTGEYIQGMIRLALKKKRMDVLLCMKHLDKKLQGCNTDELYKQGGDKWKDFCSDIVDYYCFRYRVFKTPMPTVDWKFESNK